MTEAGYSGTPLARKLGIDAGTRVRLLAAPPGFRERIAGARPRFPRSGPADVFVVFATSTAEMEERFRLAMAAVPADGSVWVAWPKKSSGVATDLTEQTMRDLFLPTGMVDNKVAAIDETWSGLRFVVRRQNRAEWNGALPSAEARRR
jgi:hypothetical protein